MLSERPHLSHMTLKIEGSPASDDVAGDLVQIVVDHSLHMPSMFTIRLHAHDMKWLEDDTFREGKKVELFLGEPPVKLLSGKIAGLEPELDEASPALVVRGYDLMHKLYRGRYRRSFLQVTDADLVKKLALESGVRLGSVDDTSEVHEYIFQNNQTNAEFLLERARRLGYELWVQDELLNCRKPGPQGAAVRLAWGDNLRSFHARLSTAAQLNEVEVRGWDPHKKQEVVGRATQGQGAPQIGVSDGQGIAKSAWGEAKMAVVHQFVRSPSEADALAQATLDESTAGFVEADGLCDPNADIVPGRQVQIEGVGQRFAGTYYVTQVIQEWNKDQGCVTHFTVSGRRDRGLWSLLEDSQEHRIKSGLGVGIVTSNKDPENMGRVKVKLPWLSGEDESTWARVVTPMAGNGRGFEYLPEVDDEVLVGFEQDDILRPYVLGAVWNGMDKPPLALSEAVGGNGQVNKRIVKSRSGHTIILDDTDGAEQITIIDKTGNNKITIHSPDNAIQIVAQGDLTIEAQGKITLKGTAGVEMTSQAQVKVEGQAGVEVSSDAQLKLSGTAGAELSSTAQATVKGSMVNVEGTGPVKVTGLPIQLN